MGLEPMTAAHPTGLHALGRGLRPRRRPPDRFVADRERTLLATVTALCMALAMAGFVGIARADVVSFDGTEAYPVGANAKSFTAGDCNGDGSIDLVAAGQNSNDVTILANTGSGDFEFALALPVVTQPTGAACVDLNGDGLVDVAAVSRNAGAITFYRQQPAGTFTAVGSRPAGVVPASLARGDVNGDGRVDIVSVGSLSNDITILINTGTDTVPPFSTIRLPIISPHAAAIADFNLDGFADIAVAGGTPPYIVILYGDGVGFAPRTEGVPSPFGQTRRPANGVGIAAGDLNQDGRPDLAFLSNDAVVTLYLGNGTGAFTFLDAFAVPEDTESIALADVNGDSLQDLILGNAATNTIQVLTATGPGQFPLPGASPPSTAFNSSGPIASRRVLLDPLDPTSSHTQAVAADGTSHVLSLVEQSTLGQLSIAPLVSMADEPQVLVLADLTNDGIADAIVGTRSSRKSSAIHVLRGNASGGYDPLPPGGTCGNGVLEGNELCDDGNLKGRDGCGKTCVPEISRSIVSLAAAHIDDDGMLDVVLVDERGVITVLYGDGQGRFRLVQPVTKATRKAPIAVSDFTGDGSADIAFIPKSRKNGNLAILSNNGLGQFSTVAIPTSLRFTGPMLSGDFDRNGLPDLAVGFRGGWSLFYNDGAGTAHEGARMGAPKGLKSLSAADLDEDGWLDVVATFASPKIPSILFRGTSSGQFAAPNPLGVNSTLTAPFVTDINEDQHHDIVDCGGVAAGCRVFFGTGTGSFGPSADAFPSSFFIGREVRGAGAGDFDKDGIVDLAGISRLDQRAVILFRGPANTPIQRVTLDTGMRPEDLAVADLNGDGLLDIIVANEGSRDLSVFVNQGQRKFLPPAPVRLPRGEGGAVALAVADINGDGRLDLAVSQADSGTVTPFLNLGGGLAALGPLETGAAPRGVALGHLNGDAVLDIVTANRSANTFTVLLSGPGDTYTRSDFDSAGLEPWDVAVTDLNGDGADDVVLVNGQIADDTTVGNVVTFLNNGAGGFGAPASVHVRGREMPRSICTGDFDADGISDVAVASQLSGDVMVLHGQGNGAWRPDERDFPLGEEAISVFCLDADGDGRTDIAFGRKKAGDVGVILTGE